MKKISILGIILIFCSLTVFSFAGSGKCPEGKYYDSRSKKCILPGEDPSGETERNFARQLIEEGQAFCVDGWCCPNEKVYAQCLESKNRAKCLRKKGCVVYGE